MPVAHQEVVRRERPHFSETGKRTPLNEGHNPLFGHAKKTSLRGEERL